MPMRGVKWACGRLCVSVCPPDLSFHHVPLEGRVGGVRARGWVRQELTPSVNVIFFPRTSLWMGSICLLSKLPFLGRDFVCRPLVKGLEMHL